MIEDEVVKSFYVTPEQHAKFIQSHKAGSPDYDNILWDTLSPEAPSPLDTALNDLNLEWILRTFSGLF